MREEALWTAASEAGPTNRHPAGDADMQLTKEQAEPRIIVYRDPADVRTNFQLLTTLLIVLGLFALSAIGNAWQYWRRPDRIVVDRSSGRVLMINDREFGETDAVKMMPDQPGEADKKYLVGEFVKLLYAVNPATRAPEVKSALEMMAPQSASKFAGYRL